MSPSRQAILDHPANGLLRALQRCVDAGVIRYYTDEEMKEALKPMVDALQNDIDQEVIRILYQRSKKYLP